MENYTKLNKTQQNEILVRMTAAAGQVFGPSAIYKTQVVQKEQEETFNAINTILLQACDMQTKMKSRKDEEMKRLQKEIDDHPPPRPPLPAIIDQGYNSIYI